MLRTGLPLVQFSGSLHPLGGERSFPGQVTMLAVVGLMQMENVLYRDSVLQRKENAKGSELWMRPRKRSSCAPRVVVDHNRALTLGCR